MRSTPAPRNAITGHVVDRFCRVLILLVPITAAILLAANFAIGADLRLSYQTLDIECTEALDIQRICSRLQREPDFELSAEELSSLEKVYSRRSTSPFEVSYGEILNGGPGFVKLGTDLRIKVGFPTNGKIPINIVLFTSEDIGSVVSINAHILTEPDGKPVVIPGSTRILKSHNSASKTYLLRTNALLVETIQRQQFSKMLGDKGPEQ